MENNQIELIEKWAKWQKKYEHSNASDLKTLLLDGKFRNFIVDLLGYCKTFDNLMDDKINITHFNLGKHSVGMKILRDILTVDPHFYGNVVAEQDLLLRQAQEEIENMEK